MCIHYGRVCGARVERMNPTNQLRFVERKIKLDPFYLAMDEKGSLMPAIKTVRILQQLWVGDADEYWGMDGEIEDIYPAPTEWRDVPVEVEL